MLRSRSLALTSPAALLARSRVRFRGVCGGLYSVAPGFVLLAQEGAGGGEEESGNFLVSPNVGLMIWTLIAFGITMLILFMGGGLAVLLGIAALGWITLPVAIAFFIFEVGLIATLQAFIFATLTSIYFGEASAGSH